ncbi:DUF1631 domain-containing protein [Tahibacter soli]|uniref:DUF1631 domain-containing protein n=1 Tax=Tahibacter soli TaxID=2983605 RepID=A0A9X4BJ67_9GAMM|nr:DUF1631 domain-containing protein [Tahibacter soli]MDC8014771.1 DUF1631 domain-containing protein [Tahibacter soli]
MQLTDPASSRRPDTETALATIGSRRDFPPRVRTLLEGVLALAGSQLERSISLSLTECEQQLFKLAEKARSSNEQHGVFESLREVKRARADVAPRYLLHFESTLARLGEERKPANGEALPRFAELALVDTRDLEENITLQEIAAKAEIRHSQALYALGHRFGVLAGSPAIDAENLAVGPQRLCAGLRYATACIGVSLEHRLVMYRQFDRLLMAELGVLYSSINDYMVEKRILRNLQLTLPRARVAARGAGPVAPKRDPGAAADATIEKAAPEPSAAAQPPAETPLAHDAADDVRDSELFTTLRELLSGRRHIQQTAAPPSPATAAAATLSSYVATAEDLQSVLGALQCKPAASMVLGGRVVQRSIAHLKQDLLNQLRQFTPDGRPPQLGEEDADTLELVGMLFDFIAKDTRPDSASQSLLTKLQVPVLRVALRDKSFFTRRSHPARQLLNAIAETGQYWIDDGDGESDRTLVEKMQLVVDRVGAEFDGKVELFDEMLTDLSRHMGMLARKAEVAERRHVDAAKGRERLDLARERAVGAIGERLAGRKINRFVRTLLEQAWTDVLALTILRQGEESDAYRRRIDVADRLIGDGVATPDVREEIEQGLAQVGFHGDEAQAMVRQLFSAGEAAGADDSPASRTEMALKLKAKTRLGEDTTTTATTPATGETASHQGTRMAPIAPPLNAAERQMLERVRTLPFGTWFEFVQNQQGEAVRRKLSWFSTLTGRCLFVNQRGARTDERSMEQLARDLVRGQARIATIERESLIDRAWHAIVGTLKQITGHAPLAPA